VFSHKIYHYLILLLIAGASGFFIFYSWKITETVQANTLVAEILPLPKKEKPVQREVKGIYLTAYTAGNSKTMDKLIDLIDQTELNAVVIDIKDYSGKILYDSRVPVVINLKTKDIRIKNLEELIKKLHEHNIYTIARQTVFQDPILAEKKTEWAIKDIGGGLWRDKMGLAWVDSSVKGVWKYNLDIAKEAIKLGFDEINFDYVRFPSDGDMSRAVYALNGRDKNQVMGEFYKYLSDSLSDQPVWISIDMFGYVMERFNGMSIGQRLIDAVDNVDYICPMMYPSHYPAGHLGLKNPAEYPKQVFENGFKIGLPYFENKRAKVRPWIQAFDMGAKYKDGIRIREQIDVVEKYTDAGWLMWNASNNYSANGLK